MSNWRCRRTARRSPSLTDRDGFAADQPSFTLYRAGAPDWQAVPVADSRTDGVPEAWWISEHGDIRFSDGGTLLHFGTAPRPEPEAEDETLEEDKITLDVWNRKAPKVGRFARAAISPVGKYAAWWNGAEPAVDKGRTLGTELVR